MVRYKEPTKEVLLIRMHKKSEIDPETNCWIWNGSNTGWSGYGYIQYKFKMTLVHRISAMIHFDFDLNSPLQICHKNFICKSKRCWNPDHIYAGTRSQNALDREEIKRGDKN